MQRLLRESQFLLEYLLLWPIVSLARRVGPRGAETMARFAGWVAYIVLRKDRQWAYKNLELVFGENLTQYERRSIVRSSFQSVARTRVECLRWTRQWMIQNVIEEGGDETRELRRKLDAEGKGLIVITAHLGNFELIPAWCHYTGFSSTVMYRPQDNWRVERLIMGARTDYLPNVVRRSTTGLMTLGYVLQEKGSVGLLVDMNTLDNPVFVEFLGFHAASPPGAAALALSTGAPVILAVAVRQKDGRHRIIFHPPFETIRTGNKKADILANTQQYMAAIEPYVQAYPEQYNWPHPRWRYRPYGSFWTPEMLTDELAKERVTPAVTRMEVPNPGALRQDRGVAPTRKAA